MPPFAVNQKIEDMKNYLTSSDYQIKRTEMMAGMNRTERRDYERREERLKKCINTLTPMHHELIENLSNIKADKKIEVFQDMIDRSISAFLVIMFPEKDWDGIVELENMYVELVKEDIEKSGKLEDECKVKGDKVMKKYEDDVRAKAQEIIEKRLGQKQAIEILITEFPTLSKSMLTNAYKKYKSEWDKAQEAAEVKEEIPVEPVETEDTVSEKAAEEEKEPEEAPKLVCDENSCSIVAPEEKKLKITMMTVVGDNGTYTVSDYGILLNKGNNAIHFENRQQFNEFVDEFNQVFDMID